MTKPKVLLTIAARGGSKGVVNKNIRPLCQLPLIAHTINQAKQWGKADRIICSTDSEEIAVVARQYGAEVPFMRPALLATDTAGKIGVLRHALHTVEEYSNEHYDVLIDLDATAPIRKVDDIEGSFQLFLNQSPDAVVSVTPCRKNPYFNMLELTQDGTVKLVKEAEGKFLRRQDAPRVFDMNASIYVYATQFLRDERHTTAISGRTLAWVMDEHSAFDIDTEEDFQFIEFLTTKGFVRL